LQNAADAQGEPVFSHSVWSRLQVCGCAPLQIRSPTEHFGGVQTFFSASQSAALTQVANVPDRPSAAQL
jgi:hypothetical protein